MNQSIQIGPLALSYGLLATFIAIVLSGFIARRMARGAGVDAEPLLTQTLLVGLVAARLGFVWQWREQYLADPLSILDVRDGGWEAAAGVAAAMLFGVHRARHQAGLRKPVVVAVLTTGAVLMFSSFWALLAPSPAVPLPPIVLSSVEGRPVALAEFFGKPTVLNLWATWCPPCQREMPVLQQAQQANSDVNVVFVNQGEAAPTIARFLARHGLALRNVLVDPERRTGLVLGHRALPTTLFFDARGRLVDTRIGELSQATLAQRLAAVRETTTPVERRTPP